MNSAIPQVSTLYAAYYDIDIFHADITQLTRLHVLVCTKDSTCNSRIDIQVYVVTPLLKMSEQPWQDNISTHMDSVSRQFWQTSRKHPTHRSLAIEKKVGYPCLLRSITAGICACIYVHVHIVKSMTSNRLSKLNNADILFEGTRGWWWKVSDVSRKLERNLRSNLSGFLYLILLT